MQIEKTPIIKVLRPAIGEKDKPTNSDPDQRIIVAIDLASLKKIINNQDGAMFSTWSEQAKHIHYGKAQSEKILVGDLQEALSIKHLASQFAILVTNYTPDINQQGSGTSEDSLRQNIENLLSS